MMRVLITGGTGLIGRALSANLAADGHEVIVLSRSAGTGREVSRGVRVVQWDARTGDGWASLAEGADAIVNLAGYNLAGSGFLPARWTVERKRLIRDSRVYAGQAVVDAVQRVSEKPRAVIQASGVGYYGSQGDTVLDEDSLPGTGFLADLAAAEWEPSTAPVEALGVRRAIARSGAVFSTEEGALPRLLLPFRFFVGGQIGNGRQWHPWIHIEDEVQALRFLIENDQARGPFNLASPSPMTDAELAKTLGRVLGRPSFMRVPALAMELAFGEVASVLLESQRSIPRRLQELGFVFRFPDAASALRDLLK
jgi:uncharacterized protein